MITILLVPHWVGYLVRFQLAEGLRANAKGGKCSLSTWSSCTWRGWLEFAQNNPRYAQLHNVLQ